MNNETESLRAWALRQENWPINGYLSRKNNLNLTKCKVQGKPEGKRVQGRPRVKLIKHHIGNSTNYIKIKNCLHGWYTVKPFYSITPPSIMSRYNITFSSEHFFLYYYYSLLKKPLYNIIFKTSLHYNVTLSTVP